MGFGLMAVTLYRYLWINNKPLECAINVDGIPTSKSQYMNYSNLFYYFLVITFSIG
jgi:hypothetical protein